MASKRKSTQRSKKESPDGTELLVQELQEIHSAESQLARVIPRLAKAVESETLREKLEERLEQGERIIQDVETCLENLEESPGRKKNVAAEGLINDAREHVQEIEAGPALDTVLIGAIQKTEHYCIAAWGTVKALGEALERTEIARAMERALQEGKQFDEELTQLAESEVTPALLAQGSEEEGEEESASTSRRSGRSRAEHRAS
jgi:ferritin-like metal-binding protein YciE